MINDDISLDSYQVFAFLFDYLIVSYSYIICMYTHFAFILQCQTISMPLKYRITTLHATSRSCTNLEDLHFLFSFRERGDQRFINARKSQLN